MHFNYFILFFVVTLSINGFSEVVLEQSFHDKFAKQSDKTMNIYRLEHSPFSESDARAKMEKLSLQGFTWTDQKKMGENNIVFQNDHGQYLFYNSSESKYRYDNPLVNELTFQEEGDTVNLRKLADGYLSDFLEEDAKDYVFTNTGKQYQALQSGGQAKMIYIMFNYVRVLDGRQVRGLSCGVTFSLGTKGNIRNFTIDKSKVIKVDKLKKQLKAASLEKYLVKYLNSTKFKETLVDSITSTNVWKSVPCYFRKMVGNDTYLVPHISFFSRNTLATGDVVRQETRLSLDPSDMPDVDTDDIIENMIVK